MKCYTIKAWSQPMTIIVNATSFAEAVKKSKVEEKEIMEISCLGDVIQ